MHRERSDQMGSMAQMGCASARRPSHVEVSV